MGKKRLITLIILIMVVGTAFTAIGVKASIEKNLNQLANLKISNIDLTKLNNGVYSGSYKAFPVGAEVRVTINSHKITAIELVKHNNGQGKPAEIIPGKVMETQRLDVDVVTGATYSSKAILKAIENALASAKK